MSVDNNQFNSMSNKLLILGNSYLKYQTFNPPIHTGVKHSKQHTIKKSHRTGRQSTRSSQQKKTRLSNIGLCNIQHNTDGYLKFITLTTAKSLFNLKLFNRQFTKFIMRWEYKLGYKIKYIAIPEQHDSLSTSPTRRGAYHMHAIMFNVPFTTTKEIQRLWGNGIVYVEGIPVKATYRGLNYVLKYIGKGETFNERVLMPRHMTKPITIINTTKPNLTPVFSISTLILDADTLVSTSLYKIN